MQKIRLRNLLFDVPNTVFDLQNIVLTENNSNFGLRKGFAGIRNIVFSDFGSPNLRFRSIIKGRKKAGKDVQNILDGGLEGLRWSSKHQNGCSEIRKRNRKGV
jgi:hypothetical protein